MSANEEPTRDADTAQAGPEIAHLRKVFADRVRAYGRVHHRALLRAMRTYLERGATELAQEVSMMLRGKLRLRPQKVKDIESVRAALKSASSATGDSP
ncbi:MAG: hypothetical protein AMK75_04840 [Planctomycetes bacterium SM23_65]|nr:MAG: hypothetical protein AMK75_04840 [Planctomycetes bacterium SM23_65]